MFGAFIIYISMKILIVGVSSPVYLRYLYCYFLVIITKQKD